MSWTEWVQDSVCPECGASLERRPHPRILACTDPSCRLVYPVVDGIPWLLDVRRRNAVRELEIFACDRAEAGTDDVRLIEKTSERLIHRVDVSKWEWEDLDYWDRHYLEEIEHFRRTGSWIDFDYGPFRSWERADLIAEAVRSGCLGPSARLLEIGAGFGQSMQRLAPQARHGHVYVATDMSHYALVGNRLRRAPSTIGFELLASGDNLPVRDGFADVVTSWGVLHHLPSKERAVAAVMPKLRPGGVFMLAEALERPQPLRGLLSAKEPNSAHDEHLDRGRLLSQLATGGRVRALSLQFSSFYGLVTGQTAQKITTRSHTLWRAIGVVDRWLCRYGSLVVPSFQPGMCLAMVERSDAKTNRVDAAARHI